MKKAFITGSTGFLGVEVLKALVESTDIVEFLLLIRDKNKGAERLKDIIKLANNLNKEVTILGGDITKDDFGLSEAEISNIKSVSEVYHLAAEVSLSRNKREKVFSVNLTGTKNLLNLFMEAKNLENLFYFSKAYINGRNREALKEDWLDKKPIFRNPYEESKWLVEQEIKSKLQSNNLPITILRPTVIATEDKPRFDEAAKQTIYLYGSILRNSIKSNNDAKIIRLIGNNNTNMNIITAIDIVKILLKIRSLTKKERIYNLANKPNLSAYSFLEGLKEALHFKEKFELIESLDIDNLSSAEKFIYDSTKAYFEYNLDGFLEWDTKNTDKIREELSIIQKDNDWLKNHVKGFFETIEYGEQKLN